MIGPNDLRTWYELSKSSNPRRLLFSRVENENRALTINRLDKIKKN